MRKLQDLYRAKILATVFLILGDRMEAEDILAESLLAAWTNAGRLQNAAAIEAWLRRVAANKALSLRRRIRHRVFLKGDELLGTPDVADRSSLSVALVQEIARLPPRMRAAIVLRYYADLTVADVASALDTSPNTVKEQLRVPRERLRVAVSRF